MNINTINQLLLPELKKQIGDGWTVFIGDGSKANNKYRYVQFLITDYGPPSWYTLKFIILSEDHIYARKKQ